MVLLDLLDTCASIWHSDPSMFANLVSNKGVIDFATRVRRENANLFSDEGNELYRIYSTSRILYTLHLHICAVMAREKFPHFRIPFSLSDTF